MQIELRKREPAHVKEYFHRVQDEEIAKMLPQTIKSLEEAVDSYYQSIKPESNSYGRTIYVDGK